MPKISKISQKAGKVPKISKISQKAPKISKISQKVLKSTKNTDYWLIKLQLRLSRNLNPDNIDKKIALQG